MWVPGYTLCIRHVVCVFFFFFFASAGSYYDVTLSGDTVPCEDDDED